MGNQHLFELINAPPGVNPLRLLLATGLAQWAIYLVPIAMAVRWVCGGDDSRRELAQMVIAALLALILAQVTTHVWPQPRPFALHLGTQYLTHAPDPGLPSDHTTALWGLGLAALGTRRFAIWAFPLLALGLVVGLSRVYLGVHFPYDVLAAFPVAAAAAAIERALRGALRGHVGRMLHFYDHLTQHEPAEPK